MTKLSMFVVQRNRHNPIFFFCQGILPACQLPRIVDLFPHVRYLLHVFASFFFPLACMGLGRYGGGPSTGDGWMIR